MNDKIVKQLERFVRGLVEIARFVESEVEADSTDDNFYLKLRMSLAFAEDFGDLIVQTAKHG